MNEHVNSTYVAGVIKSAVKSILYHYPQTDDQQDRLLPILGEDADRRMRVDQLLMLKRTCSRCYVKLKKHTMISKSKYHEPEIL